MDIKELKNEQKRLLNKLEEIAFRGYNDLTKEKSIEAYENSLKLVNWKIKDIENNK